MSMNRSGPYPIRLEVDYQEQHDRLSTLLRWFLVIPHFIVLYVLGIVMLALTVVAWFAILFTGRHPEPIHRTIVRILRWQTRVNGYSYLLTDRYPPFSGD